MNLMVSFLVIRFCFIYGFTDILKKNSRAFPPFVISSLVEMTEGLHLVVGDVVVIVATTAAGVSTAPR